jgi:hypothetical protein
MTTPVPHTPLLMSGTLTCWHGWPWHLMPWQQWAQLQVRSACRCQRLLLLDCALRLLRAGRWCCLCFLHSRNLHGLLPLGFQEACTCVLACQHLC